ncbi:MAG: hypothetical protein GX137_04645 [Thermoplasmatales archaeon]|nr:hypothetical protein [Thermoplasmatales archaeon]
MDIFNLTLQNEALTVIFFAAVFIPALAGTILSLMFRYNKVANLIAGLCITSCAVGIAAYPLRALGVPLSYTFPLSSAVGDYALAIDQISSVMISLSSVIFMLIVVHVVKSSSDSGCRYSGLLNVLFIASFLCMAADSVLVLLISWEMITLSTFLLAKKGNNDRARWMFFVIAHIGGLMLMCAYGYLAWVAGTQTLSDWNGLGAIVGSTTSMILVLMIVMGFGTKLGLLPFHAWMPGLYGTAPTHTAALLSTVCSNVAVLTIFKSIYSYIGVTESMSVIAFAIIGLAAATALWGAMESLVQKEPKKILAYSSVENMALVILCLALGMIYINESPVFAKLILIAGLLHTLNHSVFKSLMLMTIDTVEDCTGEKNIGRMGGLAKTLPLLAVVSIIGVFSMAAIPPTNGFVSEWLMIQSIMGVNLQSKGMSLLIPLVLAAVGICGMMMAASYARLYGFIFLGRPRSDGMREPRPMKNGTLLPMAVLAILCVGMGFFATVIMDVLTTGVVSVTGIAPSPSYRSVMSEEMLPLILGVLIVITSVAVLLVVRPGKEREVRTWGCGEDLGKEMQYSSIGFSQPLVRVFHPFYGDTTVVRETKEGSKKTVHTEFTEPFVRYLYMPLGNAITAISEKISKTQTNRIQTYFGYVLITLIAVLLAVRIL